MHATWSPLAAPARLYPLAGRLIPWFAAAAAVLGVAGGALALFVAPPDPAQGDVARIAFVHVPAAWTSLGLYLAMAACAMVALGTASRLPAMMMSALAPTGALFTVIALATGSLWGRPTAGAWWVWDARMTSELILLFLYVGFLSLRSAIDEPRRADRAGAVLVIVGVVNLPIIHFSVRWWNTLHQGASASLASPAATAHTMLLGMVATSLAFAMYSAAVSLARVRCVMLEREADHHRLRQGEAA
ncbi:MAG TPA: heme ABC transporter permease CcmC [Albitalea sp.]